MAEAKVWNLALIPSRQHRELSLTPCLVSVLGLAKSWRASYCNSADIARGTAQPWHSLGSGVSSKVSKSVSEITDEDCWACGYCDSRMTVYGIGMVGALVGASGFLL